MVEAISIEKIKSLGQVITPQQIAEFLAFWAIRSADDKVLEPSCGDGAFLRAAIKRLLQLGTPIEKIPSQVYGIDLDKEILEETRKNLQMEFPIIPTLINADFFDIEPQTAQRTLINSTKEGSITIPKVDVIIGNPPYIRYQLFRGGVREKALKISEEAGVKLTELTASWVPFIIHAERFLKRNGRMAVVLPSKLLHVNYAKPFRKWLLSKFPNITIVTFERRIFPRILEDTLLLLADKTGPHRVSFIKIQNEQELSSIRDINTSNILLIHPKPDEKWTKYLLPSKLTKEFGDILDKISTKVTKLGNLAFVTIGVVTGYNEFFILTEQEVTEWKIEDRYLIPIITKAEDLQGIRATNEDWNLIRKLGHKCYLLYANEPWNKLSHNMKRYLEERGKELNVRSRYKVKIRKCWYEIPGIKFPELFMSYMSYEFPKVVTNEIVINNKKATSSNTIHHIFLKKNINPLTLATAFYNSLTLASTELTGRFYGGGVLKIEPKEAENILIPVPGFNESKELLDIADKVDKLLREKRINDVIELVNEVLLEGQLGLTNHEIEILNEIWQYLQKNRIKKNKS